MDAYNAANAIISSVKKLNLIFYLEETPFSLFINVRKSFIMNKDGHYLSPPLSETSDDTIGQKLKVEKLENEKSHLSDSVEQLEAELYETKHALHLLTEKFTELSKAHTSNKEVETLKKENKTLSKKNDELQVHTLIFFFEGIP